MAEDNGQNGHRDTPGEDPRDVWAPPEQGDRLRKRPDPAAGQPTLTSATGPATGPPPPPPAPSAHRPYDPYAASGPPPAVYGYPAHPSPYGYGHPGVPDWSEPPRQGMSVASMVLGIVGLVLVLTCWGSFLSVIVSPLALVLGVVARRGIRRGELRGHGQATAGFVMGIVGTVLSVLVIVLIILSFTVWQEEMGTGFSDSSTYDASGSVSLRADLPGRRG